ncbi:hypothetical protein MC885_014882 [Smutsia gigantea]|nr:hypothetical protein MC885_014882 [Smutsia gigantea]
MNEAPAASPLRERTDSTGLRGCPWIEALLLEKSGSLK